MRPIINMPEEDRATDTGNTHKNGKDRACGSGDICIVNEKKTPSQRYAMRPIVNMSEEDRATDTRNVHKRFGKDRACGSADILADRQTDRQTDHRQTHRQTYSSQCFVTISKQNVYKVM